MSEQIKIRNELKLSQLSVVIKNLIHMLYYKVYVSIYFTQDLSSIIYIESVFILKNHNLFV